MGKTISFTPPNVRLVMEGRKTQTRRICKLEVREGMPPPEFESLLRCAAYKVGDVLSVREAWRVPKRWDRTKPRDLPHMPVRYEATAWEPHERDGWGKYRPAMFMPLWASRLKIEITEVRLERLRDISHADAIAEGATCRRVSTGDARTGLRDCWTVAGFEALDDPRGAYELLWESLNGAGSWAANPWVWAYTFRRVS